MSAALKPPGNWTDAEDKYLARAIRSRASLATVAADLNRAVESVKVRAFILKRLRGL